MSRSHRLKSDQVDTLPRDFERDLMTAFGLPTQADRLLVGQTWAPWSNWSRVAYVTVPLFAAELRRRGWSASAVRAAVARLNRYDERPDSDDLRICRRAYRRVMRQLVNTGRYEEVDAYPHRRWDNWW
jgi:hypothetical protein